MKMVSNDSHTNYQYLSDYAQKCLSVENEDKPNGYDIVHTLELAQRIPIRCTLDTHHYDCHRMVETERVKVGEKQVNRKVREGRLYYSYVRPF